MAQQAISEHIGNKLRFIKRVVEARFEYIALYPIFVFEGGGFFSAMRFFLICFH